MMQIDDHALGNTIIFFTQTSLHTASTYAKEGDHTTVRLGVCCFSQAIAISLVNII